MKASPLVTHRPGVARAALLAGLALALVAAPCLAGSGTFQGGAYNFCVSVRFNATPAQLAQIRTGFQNGSQVFADATDGQQRFGTVTLVNDSGASQSAEYWVNPGTGRAYATYGRYAERGQHVNLFFASNFQASNGADGDAYTIAHEHAHHAFGVADEYSGPAGPGDCAPPPDAATLNFSLMDNYFTRGGNAPGNGGLYTLNEFCTAGNHDPDADTYQESLYGVSAWETIASHPTRAATPPAGLPDDAPPAAHAVTFADGFGGLRVVLVLDRSGSMASDSRLTFAKEGGKLFVDRLSDGDGLGVTSFECATSVNFPLTTITGPATRTAAKAAIDSLVASGSTNIGGGLLTGLGQLTAQPTRSCNEILVLLSDGDHNCGTHPSAVIPMLQAQAVTVMSVGVGSGISTTGEATLQSVATATGGLYFRVASSSDLTGLFMRLAAEASGTGLLTRAPEAVAQGQTAQVPVTVEQGAGEATFAVTLADQADQIVFTLETPSGQLIDEAAAAADPDIDFESRPNSRLFVVRTPEPGLWSAMATAGTVVSGRLEFLAFADNDGTDLHLGLRDQTPAFPQAAVVEATPTFGGLAVVGAEVAGVVQRPGGSSVSLSLYDDGLPQHADAVAGDGIYTGLFDDYLGNGTYTFELTATTEEGGIYAGEALFPGAPPAPAPVPKFVRMASVAAVLTGSPGAAVATVEYMPEPLNFATRGAHVQAFIELPPGLDPAAIDPATVKITAVDGQAIAPVPIVPGLVALGDFDNDGVADLRVNFERAKLKPHLPAGVHELRLEGKVGGQPFAGLRNVSVL